MYLYNQCMLSGVAYPEYGPLTRVGILAMVDTVNAHISSVHRYLTTLTSYEVANLLGKASLNTGPAHLGSLLWIFEALDTSILLQIPTTLITILYCPRRENNQDTDHEKQKIGDGNKAPLHYELRRLSDYQCGFVQRLDITSDTVSFIHNEAICLQKYVIQTFIQQVS